MDEKHINLIALVIAVLSAIGFFIGWDKPITLWIHLIIAIIFYMTAAINSFVTAKKRHGLFAVIHNSFVMLITQIFLFAILMYAYLAILSGISTSGMLQLFSNASIYVSSFSLVSICSIYKAQSNFTLLHKKLKIFTFYTWLLIGVILIVVFILLNMFLIYQDINFQKNNVQVECLWLVSYWLACFVTPIILSISNVFDKLVANK